MRRRNFKSAEEKLIINLNQKRNLTWSNPTYLFGSGAKETVESAFAKLESSDKFIILPHSKNIDPFFDLCGELFNFLPHIPDDLKVDSNIIANLRTNLFSLRKIIRESKVNTFSERRQYEASVSKQLKQISDIILRLYKNTKKFVFWVSIDERSKFNYDILRMLDHITASGNFLVVVNCEFTKETAIDSLADTTEKEPTGVFVSFITKNDLILAD